MSKEEPRLIELVVKAKPYNKQKFVWYTASDDITIEDIRNHLDLPWDFACVGHKKNITIQDILKPIPKTKKGRELWNWDFYRLSYNIHPDDILANPQLPWNFRYVSFNHDLEFKHVLANKDQKWDWRSISSIMKISIQEILDNRYEPYDFKSLSLNKSLSVDDILAHQDLPWNIPNLSRNPNIQIRHLLKYPNLKWDWYYLSFSIPMADIVRYSKLPWRWQCVASNNHFHIRHIVENIDIYIPFLSSVVAFEKKITEDTIDLYLEAYDLYAKYHNHQFDVAYNKHIEQKYERISLYFYGSVEFILAHPEYKWCMNDLLKNKNFTPSQLIRLMNASKEKDNPSFSVYYEGIGACLSVHPLLSVQDILDHPEISWNFTNIAKMHNQITFRDMLMYPQIPWE